MNVYETILKRRTVRIFQKKELSKETLKNLVNAGRLAPSARNLQPLEFLVIKNKKICDKVFENITFGGETEKLQTKENQPVSYILVLVNKKIRDKDFEHDSGLASGNIVLSAWEKEIGGCIMGAINRKNLSKILSIPSDYFIDLVIALGYPAEKPEKEESRKEKYWRDKEGNLHVPKKEIEKVLHWNEFQKK